MEALSAWQWVLLALGAFFSGLSKTGVAGLGILTVALFANAIDPRQSTGALLPLLVAADLFAVAFYRKHANWGYLVRLLPWVVAGVAAGYFALGKISNSQVSHLIGGTLLAMVVLHLWRQRRLARDPEAASRQVPHRLWFAALTGILAGFTTMVANAAGPVMVLYFLSMGLPKLAFLGTAAWFFLIVNTIKLPLSHHLGLIRPGSLLLDAILLLPMIPGALLGPWIVRHLPQRAFDALVLVLTVLAAIRLVMVK
jgi:uncharacterized membrane protein YfcA